jgi:hypothetical protein
MALDFPSAGLTIGQKFPASPIAGVPTYSWDGQKWTTSTGPVATKTSVFTDGSTAMTAQLTLSGDPVNPTDAADKHYVDNAAVAGGYMKVAGNQTLTGGFGLTPFSIGNFPASFAPNPMNGNYQYGTNNGAFTFNAPTVDCAIDFLSTNSATAGAITFTGFTYAATNYGDALTTTNGQRFIISIRRINGISTFTIKALQ